MSVIMPIIGTDQILQIGDVHMDFKDSCNCPSLCCMPRKKKAYINSQVRAERFDSKKAIHGDEVTKSVTRLETFVFNYIRDLPEESQDMFMQEMEKHRVLDFQKLKEKKTLTFKRIHKINKALELILQSLGEL